MQEGSKQFQSFGKKNTMNDDCTCDLLCPIPGSYFRDTDSLILDFRSQHHLGIINLQAYIYSVEMYRL